MRCKYDKVFNFESKKFRTCKKKVKCLNYCIIHLKILYEKYIILIQKVYKGFYIRKKLNIYYKLPRELQRKIIWHMNSNLYLKHFNSSLSKLIYKRYYNFKFIYNDYLTPYFFPNTIFLTSLNKTNIDNLLYDYFSLIKLSIKYNSIMYYNKIPYINDILNFTLKIRRCFDHISDEHQLINKYIYLFN